MYARGMTVREIRAHLEELYGIDVSPDLISTVTDAVLEAVAEWQGRPLDTCYPLVFFDAIRVKIRDEGFVRNKAVYIALGIQRRRRAEGGARHLDRADRGRQVLAQGLNELKNRGIADILIAVVDGLKGFPEAASCIYPEQHELRVLEGPQADRPGTAERLSCRDAEGRPGGAGGVRGRPLGQQHPAIVQSWRRHWDQVIPFFAFPRESAGSSTPRTPSRL